MRIVKVAGRAALAAASALVTLSLLPLVDQAYASNLPFSDPNADGFIGLCDKTGQNVTSGSLRDQPFVWLSVSSSQAPSGYAHGKATLYAFQPRQNIDPGEWSGEPLTGSSTFSNPAHPMVQATYGDVPLQSFVGGFPARWDGLVQLRIYFTALDASPFRSNYPATVIRVSGDRWTVVNGGPVACGAGHATSNEGAVLPYSQRANSGSGTVGANGAGGANGQAASPGQNPVGSGAGQKVAGAFRTGKTPAKKSPALSGDAGDGGDWVPAAVGIGLGFAAVGGGVAAARRWRRRRRAMVTT